MLRYIIALLLGFAALSAVVMPASAQRGNPDLSFGGQTIDAMIAEYMAENAVPGMALAVIQASQITRLSGYGLADSEKKLLVGMNSAFDIGQMAEAFTAVAVMQLVEAGKLKLEDTIGKHLPDLPKTWQPLSVHALLAHASGLPDYTRDAAYDPMREATPAELIAPVATKPFTFKPGQDVANSATDYLLLAQIIQQVSGMPYRDFLRRHQFEPLGLRDIVFADEVERFRSDTAMMNPAERATGYRDGAPASLAPPAARLGSGGILATALDLARWAAGLAGDALIKDADLRNALSGPVILPDGRSLPVNGAWRFPGRKGLMYTTGSASGHTAFLSRFTAADDMLALVLLANKDGLDLTTLARRIAGAYDQRLGPPAGKDLRARQSPYPASQAFERFAAIVKREKLGSMSRISEIGGVTTATLTPPAADPLPVATTPVSPIRATAWEEKGQVWLGILDKGQPAPGDLRRRIDEALLRAVTPY